MSENQLFENELFERLRDVAPQVPAEVLSPAGSSAQRVLARVLATPRGDRAAGLTYDVPTRSASRTGRWRTWLRARPVAAVTSLAAVAAVVISILVIAGGGASSIVAGAYAATDPAGVIVHYVESSHSSLEASPVPDITEFWTYGHNSRQLINANKPQRRQDIVSDGGQVRNLAFGTLLIMPAWPANTHCAAAMILEGDCAEGQKSDPIGALRTLYRSGQIRATSHTTINGRRVDVLTGKSNELRVRALIDARTFLPITVTMTETFPQAHGVRPITYALTITGYQRLPVTARNLQLLQLPAHPHVQVVRFHSCPTKTNPHRLCS